MKTQVKVIIEIMLELLVMDVHKLSVINPEESQEKFRKIVTFSGDDGHIYNYYGKKVK